GAPGPAVDPRRARRPGGDPRHLGDRAGRRGCDHRRIAMSVHLARGPLTAALLTQLTELGKPVGDAIKPPEGGWQGQPNAPESTFVPYLVLTPQTAMVSSGSLGASQSEWRVPYTLASYGVRRDQCEWMADTARAYLNAQLRRQRLVLGAGTFTVQ